MRIVLGADHRGAECIRRLADKLARDGHEVRILGDASGAVCDYPEPAWRVAKSIASGEAEAGILVCGTGIGMAMAANKVRGVRAATVHDEFTAKLSRSHNNANIICVSADLLGQRLIEKIVDTYLSSEFEGGRHQRRIHKIEAIEEGRDPAEVRNAS